MTQKGFEQIFKSLTSQEPLKDMAVSFSGQEFDSEYEELPGIVALEGSTRVDGSRLVRMFRISPDAVSQDLKSTRVGLFAKFETGAWVLISEVLGEWLLKKGTPWSGYYNIQFVATGTSLDVGGKHAYRDGESVIVVDDEGKVY